jgi:hypothetical protein
MTITSYYEESTTTRIGKRELKEFNSFPADQVYTAYHQSGLGSIIIITKRFSYVSLYVIRS